MWLHTATSWETLSVRVAPAKYETIPWGIAGWSPTIHTVGSDRPHTARATVPRLGMILYNNGMYVATYCHELGHTFGTCGSCGVRTFTL
jgi:hypothetical protein